MSAWVSVKDRLPDEEKRVLAYVKYHCWYPDAGYIYQSVMVEATCSRPVGRKPKRRWFLWTRADIGTECIDGEVTHWRTLPRKPKEDDHDNV